MSILLVLSFLLSISWVLLKTRNPVALSLHVIGSLALAGTVLMISERFLHLLNVQFSQVIVAICFIAVGYWNIHIFNQRLVVKPSLKWIFPLISAGLALLFVLNRIVASENLDQVFAGVGRIASAEDNAKWLNFSANIAQGNLINVKDGTTGGLAALLILTSALVEVYSIFVLGNVAVVGVTIFAVFVAHTFILLLVPFVISATFLYIGHIFQTPAINQLGVLSEASKSYRLASSLIATSLLVLAFAAISSFGHLSFEFAILEVLTWATFVTYLWKFNSSFLLVTIIGSSSAMVWLPLPFFAIAIGLFGTLVALYRWKKSKKTIELIYFICTFIYLFVVVWIALPEVQYISATANPSQSIDLVQAEGAAMALRKFEIGIFLLASLGVFLALWRLQSVFRYRFEEYLFLFPLVIICGYPAAIAAYDLVVAPAGWPHYGTRKIIYGLLIIATSLMIPIAGMGFLWIKSKLLVPITFSALILGLVIFSGTAMRVKESQILTPMWWTVTDKANNGSISNTWIQELNMHADSSDISNYPIACIQLEDGKIVVGYTTHYYCTRMLISMHALEDRAVPLVVPLVFPKNEEFIPTLEQIENYAGAYPVLLIDAHGLVTNKINVSDLINIYKKQ